MSVVVLMQLLQGHVQLPLMPLMPLSSLIRVDLHHNETSVKALLLSQKVGLAYIQVRVFACQVSLLGSQLSLNP